MRHDVPDPPPPDDFSRPLIALIASQPGMAHRLLLTHKPTTTGHCAVCSAGAQTGRHRWPCTITLAARRVLEQRVAP